MESNAILQTNVVPNSQEGSFFHSAASLQHQIHCVPHYHWVCPPLICGNAPIPRCPNCLKISAFLPTAPTCIANGLASSEHESPSSASPEDTKRKESLPADKMANGSSAQANASNTSTANPSKDTSIGGQCAPVQSPCFCMPVHPTMHSHGPVCPFHHFLPCRVHGCWQPSPCSIRPPFLPFPMCLMPQFVPFMPPSCPANSGYSKPDLSGGETFSGKVAGEPTSSHVVTECEKLHGNGQFQDSQNGAMEVAYEIQEEEEEEPIFVLTDEWMEFFAKSEARRQQKKKQQQKEAKKIRKAEKLTLKKQENEVEDSFLGGSEDGNASIIA